MLLMSAEQYAAKAVEMDDKADVCLSAEAADLYRTLASEWRKLQTVAIAEARLDPSLNRPYNAASGQR